MKTGVLAVAALWLACSACLAQPFSLAADTPADGLTIDTGDPASFSLTFVVRATSIQGIGAVSGFESMLITTTNTPGQGSLAAEVLAPFDAVAPSNGTTGDQVSGVAGGQLGFPPEFPISFETGLFRVHYTETALVEREFFIDIGGLGGVFVSDDGTSTVPFQQLGSTRVRVRVVPDPASASLLLLAGLSRRRCR